MRVPVSWLHDFAPGLGADVGVLTDACNELGLVVDGVEHVGQGLDGVVVARVAATRPHPDADRIQLVDVDAGGQAPLQVACGAFNFGPGDLVPLATVGTTLADGRAISRRRLRGQWSEGMLCSGAELGLSRDAAGIMVLPPGLEIGQPVADALGITTEVVLDLDIETNRPDALSVAGVARDLAAHLHVPFVLPDPPAPWVGGDVSLTVEAPALCPRLTGTVLAGVVVAPSPEAVSRRLTLAGMRPINNVVDASNYVMLELGQPTHPYDLDRLPGSGLLVRAARPGERVTTLDGVERVLGGGPFEDCVICDAHSSSVGIGGIMGGASSEISGTTATVLVEAAWFTPMAIARTSKRLGLRSEASVRFERGCDPEGIERAVSRLSQLLAGARVEAGLACVEDAGHLPRRPRVTVRTARANSVLGTSLTDEQVRAYLEPIGFEAEPRGEGVHEVVVPSFRSDSEREIDVIEEIARHHGYERVLRTLPAVTQVGRLTPRQRERRFLADVLAGEGCDEAFPVTLIGPADLERSGLAADALVLDNPMAREESVLRPSLLPGLLRAVALNHSHRVLDVRLFEIGHVYAPADDPDRMLPHESESLGVVLADGDSGGDDGRDPDHDDVGAVAATRLWHTVSGAMRLKGGALEAARVPGLHPTRAALIICGKSVLGTVGEVDPAVVQSYGISGRLGWLECDLQRLLSAPRLPEEAAPVSRFPSSDVDLAFAVDENVPASAVESTLRASGGDLLVDLRLFDVYRGPGMDEGRRSLAYRLRFCALDHTLTDEEVAEVRSRCIAAVEADHAARLRG